MVNFFMCLASVTLIKPPFRQQRALVQLVLYSSFFRRQRGEGSKFRKESTTKEKECFDEMMNIYYTRFKIYYEKQRLVNRFTGF